MGDECLMSNLTVQDLVKQYSLEGKSFTVLDKLSFSVDSGDFLTILGPSGCGKTTLIRCICSIEEPTSGKILLDGEPISGIGPDRLMVFQDFNQLFPWKTVIENVIYPLKLNKVSGDMKVLTRRAEEFLELVHLSEFKHAYPNQLSGGMRQRVAIARSLALNPKVLVMDEPFGALDAQTRSILQKELKTLWRKFKTTIIFITHNVQEAILLGSKVMVLSLSPARIKYYEENPLPEPRMPETPEFMDLWHTLYDQLDTRRY